MDTVPPIVDCGVHYVDVMCAMVGGGLRPVRVSGIGARLTEDLRQPEMCVHPHYRLGLHCTKGEWQTLLNASPRKESARLRAVCCVQSRPHVRLKRQVTFCASEQVQLRPTASDI